MNIQEACALLGVPVGASDLDVKTAFKRKAIEYHPDRNKSPDAEVKFKRINEAYQFLEKYGTKQPAHNDVRSPFYDPSVDFAEEIRRRMDEVFTGSFRPADVPKEPPLVVNLSISFEESAKGCKKDITYTRISKCPECKDGKAKVVCTKCGGSGKRKYGAGAQMSEAELTCNACLGTGSVAIGARCTSCNGSFKKMTTETATVVIDAGVKDGAKVYLKGKGNYRAKEIYDDLLLAISVQPNDKGLTLNGDDVISTVELTLLEALKGTKKSLNTIKGDKILEFKPKMRNGDRIRVSGFGVPPDGAHIFIVNVTYPDDVSKLIEVLENNIPKAPTIPNIGIG